jgi:cell division transport system permease protein
MTRWLRHHRYAFVVALRRLRAQPFSSLANVLVISLSLTIPILAAAILVSAQPVVREIPVSPEITLFLHTDTELEQAQRLADQLQAENAQAIAQVAVVNRDSALQSLNANPTWREALSALPENPLPHAIIVTLHESEQLANQASSLASQWQALDQVESVQLDSDWVRRLEAILRFISAGLGLLAAGVAVVVLATIFNTVRMQALSQREEIGVARLVGATEAFVRRPFLYLGAVTGLVSSGLAIALAALALVPLNAALARLGNSYGAQLSLQMPNAATLLLATLFVAFLGALSARWSVTRTTRF